MGHWRIRNLQRAKRLKNGNPPPKKHEEKFGVSSICGGGKTPVPKTMERPLFGFTSFI